MTLTQELEKYRRDAEKKARELAQRAQIEEQGTERREPREKDAGKEKDVSRREPSRSERSSKSKRWLGSFLLPFNDMR